MLAKTIGVCTTWKMTISVLPTEATPSSIKCFISLFVLNFFHAISWHYDFCFDNITYRAFEAYNGSHQKGDMGYCNLPNLSPSMGAQLGTFEVPEWHDLWGNPKIR